MELKIKALSPKLGTEIPFPSYATAGSAGMDLRACIDAPVEVPALGRQCVKVPTGMAVAIPEGYVGLVFARSGLAIKSGVTPANCVGVIDSDYRGEVIVGLVNRTETAYTVNPGDRIAQMAIMPVIQPVITVADELDETDRGSGGFGSTGKA